MEINTKTIKKLLFITGTAEIAMGLAHFLFPGSILKSEGFNHLNSVEADIVTLCTFSVGILLIAVGWISILCSKKYDTNKDIALNFVSISLIMWLMRIILELIYPVKVTIFAIENPTIFALPVFLALWIILGLTVIFIWTDKRKERFASS